MTVAFTFPGQGSQSVGMGRAFYDASAAAREVFDEVDDALGEKLSAIIFNGPQDELTLTANTQPALMAVSIAAMHFLSEQGISVDAASFVAGHSLGEYTALCAAGALSLSDTARLLRLRGQSMQNAVPAGEGAMAALIGASMAQAEEIAAKAAEGAVCEIANDNAPGQVVLSGKASALDRVLSLAKEAGIKRAVLLPVSAPFHCSMMQPAAEAMAAALETTTIKAPRRPVVTNVLAAATSDPAVIKAGLIDQVTGRVRWRECVATLAREGVTTPIEVGAGKVLCGLARRIDRSLNPAAFNTPDDFAAIAASLAG